MVQPHKCANHFVVIDHLPLLQLNSYTVNEIKLLEPSIKIVRCRQQFKEPKKVMNQLKIKQLQPMDQRKRNELEDLLSSTLFVMRLYPCINKLFSLSFIGPLLFYFYFNFKFEICYVQHYKMKIWWSLTEYVEKSLLIKGN